MTYRKMHACLLGLLFSQVCVARDVISLLPASARLQGVQMATTRTSSGGDVNFVRGFTNGDERLEFSFESPGGLYEARLQYRAEGHKGYIIEINHLKCEATLEASGEQFAEATPVRIMLNEGKNDLSIGGGWGHYEIARVDLLPIELPKPPKAPLGGPCDARATPEAIRLWKKLKDSYGKTTYGGVDDVNDLAYVEARTGQTPAMLTADLIDYSPSRVERGTESKITPERLIPLSRSGEMLAMMWHWNAPTDLIDDGTRTESLPMKKRWFMGFYTDASTFDYAAALADEKSANYKLLLRDIDAIAVPLKQLQAAKVAILWRPLHEAEGGWFWWGTKGPENYVKLWRLVYDRLTRYHHLHNMLWVYTAGENHKWYPGDDVVDIVGVDCYPKDNRDPLTCSWQTVLTQYGDRKLLALSEVGFVPDIDFARKHGVYWSYYGTWNGDLGPQNLPDDELKRRFESPFVTNR